MNVTAQTLREQHRERTGAAIHEATYRLVEAHGITATSIDDIASKAGVSRRTFFNYFASKEHALLGLMIPTLPESAVAAFNASTESPLLRCVHIILSAYDTSVATGSSKERRRQLFVAYPEIHTKVEAYMGEIEQLVEPVVSQAFTNTPVPTSLILQLAGAVLRYCNKTNQPITTATLKSVIETLHDITKGI